MVFCLFLNLAGTSDCKVIAHKDLARTTKALSTVQKRFSFWSLCSILANVHMLPPPSSQVPHWHFRNAKIHKVLLILFGPILFRFLDYLSGPLGADFGKRMQHAG